MNPNFNPKDAQGKQVLGEAAGLQKAIYVKTGHDYMTWLREVELKGMGIDGNTIEEYVGALVTLDAKGFRQFFQVRHASNSTQRVAADACLDICSEERPVIPCFPRDLEFWTSIAGATDGRLSPKSCMARGVRFIFGL